LKEENKTCLKEKNVTSFLGVFLLNRDGRWSASDTHEKPIIITVE
jgi:hypothetical protein